MPLHTIGVKLPNGRFGITFGDCMRSDSQPLAAPCRTTHRHASLPLIANRLECD